MIKVYEQCVKKAPWLTNGATGIIIAAAGDYASQKYFEKDLLPEPEQFVWNAKRSIDMGILRAVVITPFVLAWYPFLARISPGQTPMGVLGRIALDQAIGSPLVISLVFAGNALLSNTLSSLPNTFKQQFFTTWLTGAKYWPFVHCVNFGFVPLTHQPLFAHVASVYWNAVLSYYANLDKTIKSKDAAVS